MVLLTWCPVGDDGGGVRGNTQTSVVGAYQVTYGELPFESLLSGLKLTPSLSQKSDQRHSLGSYNHSPQSSPSPSYCCYYLAQSRNSSPSAASWQTTLPMSGSIFCDQTAYWLKPTSLGLLPMVLTLSSGHRELYV